MSCQFSSLRKTTFREVISNPSLTPDLFFSELLENTYVNPDLVHWKLDAADVSTIATALTGGWHIVTNPDEAPPTGTLPAGITYLGQLVTHDIVEARDTSSGRENVTPFLNLDSIYPITELENGIAVNPDPELIDQKGRFIVEVHIDGVGDRFFDYKRFDDVWPRKIAKIREPRNDENQILSQLTTLIMRYHNSLITLLEINGQTGGRNFDYTMARNFTILIFQKIVRDEFLRSVLSPAVFDYCFGSKKRYFFHGFPSRNPSVPPEFSHVFFRFGHSMVRQRYNINRSNNLGLGQLFRRHTPLSEGRVLDWNLFFREKESQTVPEKFNHASQVGLSLPGGLMFVPQDIRFQKVEQLGPDTADKYEIPLGYSASHDQPLNEFTPPFGNEEKAGVSGTGFPRYLFRIAELLRLSNSQGAINVIMEDIDASKGLPTGGDIVGALSSSSDATIQKYLKKSSFPKFERYECRLNMQLVDSPLYRIEVYRKEQNNSYVRERLNLDTAPLFLFSLRESELFPEEIIFGSSSVISDKLGPLSSTVIGEVVAESIRGAEVNIFDSKSVTQLFPSKLKWLYRRHSKSPKLPKLVRFILNQERKQYENM